MGGAAASVAVPPAADRSTIFRWPHRDHSRASSAVGCSLERATSCRGILRPRCPRIWTLFALDLRRGWERGDFGASHWVDPEIEFVFAEGPVPGRWGGLEGMRDGLRANLSAWEDMHVAADEYREVDDEHVLVLEHLSGRGKRADWTSLRWGPARLPCSGSAMAR